MPISDLLLKRALVVLDRFNRFIDDHPEAVGEGLGSRPQIDDETAQQCAEIASDINGYLRCKEVGEN